MKLRPKVAEVVMHLGRAAADWNGLMPPCPQTDFEEPKESTSNSIEHCESQILILPDIAH